ncbi:MAG: UDP-glucose 4-epimerase GalE [Methylophilaceae bacterium]|jgi:UDP-glucose 4-epimerase|nr:UDP-glucose 4-epimerase GalE [Methylophilaceae bacterium]
MTRILVTGGAGYIGSHACVELLNANFDVVVLDNLCNSKATSIKRVEKITGKSITLIEGDVRNKDCLTTLFSTHKIDAVIHFAGLKAVGDSVKNPLEYYDNNVIGSITLLQVMSVFAVKNIVFSSSATVYGFSDDKPIPETAPLSPFNPYGHNKRMVEQVLTDISFADSSWNIALLRYFNPVGAHPSGEIGEDPNGEPSNLMPYISQVAVGKRERLSVFGNDYPTVDGTGVRDYIHVVDLALGHVAALNKLMQGTGILTLNLGAGRGHSVLELVQAFETATGQTIPYEIMGRRAGDIAIYFADTSLAKQMLGWRTIKTLEDICRDAWGWQTKNPNGY